MIEKTISIDEGAVETTQTTAPENNKTLAEKDFYFAEEDTVADGENQPEETVELILYGEKVTLPVSQAKEAAQKGLAFDHIKNQLQETKNDARIKALEAIAATSGRTVAQLMCEMQQRAVTDSIIEKYGSIEAAPFEELSRGVNTIAAMEKSFGEVEKTAEKQHWKAQLREFHHNNPGVREIPQEVVEMAKKGEDLSLAYHRFTAVQLEQQLQETQRKLEALKAENKSAKSSTPSAANVGAANRKNEDEFYRMMRSTW